MAVWTPRPDLNFLRLQTAVFCAECELISDNCTSHCYACGSRAILSLARLLGGSLRREPTAKLLHDAAMDRIVRELLATVPGPLEAVEEKTALIAARNSQEAGSLPDEIATKPALLDLEPAISVIAERAQALTAASGSAIGLRWNDEVVCSARAGRTAPDLGVRLQVQQGLSGQCVHSGEVIRCDDAEKHPHVDRTSCRRLGVRSILVAPLQHFRKTLGIFEVLSSEPYAFNDAAVANLQMLTGFMVAAIARAAGLQRSKERRR